MTVPEYVALKATLQAMDNKEFMCSTCLCKYQGRADEETMIQKWRENKGCFDIKSTHLFSFGTLRFSTCPGNFYSHAAVSIVDNYRHFQRGVMPYPGALVDQPAKIFDAFVIIEGHQAEKAMAEKQRQKFQQTNKGGPRGGRRR